MADTSRNRVVWLDNKGGVIKEVVGFNDPNAVALNHATDLC